jgi:DnaJ family protein C protein 7
MVLEYQEALEDCDRAIQVDQKFIKAHFRKAKVLTTLGRLDEALKAYSYGLIHDPNNANAIKERTEVQTIQKRFQLANEVLLKTDHTKHHARQALAQIQIVLASCPSWNDATLVKVDALSRMNRIEEAYSLSTKLMRQGYENNNDLIYIRAKCLFYQGALDQAMTHLRMILSSDPDNKKAFQMVKILRALKKLKEEADTAYKAKKFDDALKLYGDAIATCPPDNTSYTAKLYFNRAVSYNGLRQHAECVADCTKALSLNDEYQKAYLRRAASNLLIGGKEECTQAISDYEQASRLAKTDEEKEDIHKKIRNAKVQLKRAGRKDLYKIMGVARDANESEIKKAYRKMALKHHVRTFSLSCVVVVVVLRAAVIC